MIYLTGVPAKEACVRCAEGMGPLQGCIVPRLSDELPPSCSNCAYHGKAFRCSFNKGAAAAIATENSDDVALVRSDLSFPQPPDNKNNNGNPNLKSKPRSLSQQASTGAKEQLVSSKIRNQIGATPGESHAAEGLLTLRIGQLRIMDAKSKAQARMEMEI